MGNLLFCGDHDHLKNSSKSRAGKEVEPRPLPMSGKAPTQLPPSADHLGFLGVMSQRMHNHHFSQGSHYLLHRYRRSSDKKEKDKKKGSISSESKLAKPETTKTSSEEQNPNKNSNKFVSCSSLTYSNKTATVFPSSFSNLNKEKSKQVDIQKDQSVSVQSSSALSRNELSIRNRKYPLPLTPGGKPPTLKEPLLKPYRSRSSSASFGSHNPSKSSSKSVLNFNDSRKNSGSIKGQSGKSSTSSAKMTKTSGKDVVIRKK